MHTVTTEEIVTVACEQDDKLVTYKYTYIDGNLSINEMIENEVQEVNISFDEIVQVIELIMRHNLAHTHLIN